MGQKMGLWNHGFDFARFSRQLFRDIDFRNKTMLEIGCGKGMLCLWAAIHGARDVVGLEPLAEGCYDSSECHKAFRSMAQQLDLPQARILPQTVQAFDSPNNYFDVVLSVASINHLDEKNCIALGESTEAEREYQNIFRNIARHDEAGRKAHHYRRCAAQFFWRPWHAQSDVAQYRMVQTSAAGVLGQTAERVRLRRAPDLLERRETSALCRILPAFPKRFLISDRASFAWS